MLKRGFTHHFPTFCPIYGTSTAHDSKISAQPENCQRIYHTHTTAHKLDPKKKRKQNCQVKPKESDLLETKAEEDIRWKKITSPSPE